MIPGTHNKPTNDTNDFLTKTLDGNDIGLMKKTGLVLVFIASVVESKGHHRMAWSSKNQVCKNSSILTTFLLIKYVYSTVMLKVLFSNINQQIEGKNLVSVEQKKLFKGQRCSQ